MSTFLLIRHGLTSATGTVLTSRLPGYGLSEEGQRQAEAVAEALREEPIAALYSSPLERAQQTASPLAAELRLQVNLLEAFTELEFGDWSGKRIAELDELAEWRAFNQLRSTLRPPGGESILDLQLRTVDELERLRAKHAEQAVAIFTHAAPIQAVLLHALGMSGDFVHRLEISPGSISVVQWEAWGPRVLAVNRLPSPYM